MNIEDILRPGSVWHWHNSPLDRVKIDIVLGGQVFYRNFKNKSLETPIHKTKIQNFLYWRIPVYEVEGFEV